MEPRAQPCSGALSSPATTRPAAPSPQPRDLGCRRADRNNAHCHRRHHRIRPGRSHKRKGTIHPGKVHHVRISTTTTPATRATVRERITWMRGGGAGRPSAIAASTLSQRSQAKNTDNAATEASSTACPRTATDGHGTSIATRAAAASKPRDVRIQARIVRSLASEYRGSEPSSVTPRVSHRGGRTTR